MIRAMAIYPMHIDVNAPLRYRWYRRLWAWLHHETLPETWGDVLVDLTSKMAAL